MLTKRLAFILWILCIIGSLAIIPYLMFIQPGKLAGSYPQLLIISMLQAMLLFGAAIFFSYHLLKKMDLRPFGRQYKTKETLKYALFTGIALSLVVFTLDKTIFNASKISGLQIPSWAGLCSSLYGAINEEVLMRLFFVTLIYYLLNKIFKNTSKSRSYLLWGSIAVATIAFGIGHLGIAYKLRMATNLEVTRIMVLNGLAGIVFGWLYCYHGFWAAVGAHFVADLMLHVILI